MNSTDKTDTPQTSSEEKKLIILTAGGTGGHVYPAEALAEELLHRGYRLALVTDSRGKDNYRGTLGKIPNYAVMAGGMVGKSELTKLQSLGKIFIGILQSCLILLRHKPACVIGFGGYASFPCAMAAVLLGIKLIIHEQNSVMSRTNRFLSKYAVLIAQSFKKVKHTPAGVKTVLTGMPVRQNIVELNKRGYPRPGANDPLQLLILGGSQGAKIFGQLLPSALSLLPPETAKRLKVYQQCNKDMKDDLKKIYKETSLNVTVSPFFENMAELYASTNVIISRAGASSVSEIAVAGIPSILVPLPTAADDHQTGNTHDLAAVGGAIVIPQTDFTAGKVANILTSLLTDGEQLEKMSRAARQVAISDAAVRFADAVETEIQA